MPRTANTSNINNSVDAATRAIVRSEMANFVTAFAASYFAKGSSGFTKASGVTRRRRRTSATVTAATTRKRKTRGPNKKTASN